MPPEALDAIKNVYDLRVITQLFVPVNFAMARPNRAPHVSVNRRQNYFEKRGLNREPWFETAQIVAITPPGVNPNLPFSVGVRSFLLPPTHSIIRESPDGNLTHPGGL